MDQCTLNLILDEFIARDNRNLSYQSKILSRTKLVHDLQLNTKINLLYLLFYFFVIITNTLRIVGVNKTRKNNNERSIIKDLFCLTSLLGVFTGILATVTMLGKMLFWCNIEYITFNLERNVVVSDFFVLLCIGILRFISLQFPFKEIKQKWVRLALGLYFTFIISFQIYAFLLRYIFFNNEFDHYKVPTLLVGICMALNCFSVFFLQYSLLKGSKKDKHLQTRSIERQRKAIRRLTVINCVYLVFNLPYVLYLQDLLFRTNLGTAKHIAWRMKIQQIICNFSLLYSGIGAFIYITWDKDIVKFYKRIIRKMDKSKQKIEVQEAIQS